MRTLPYRPELDGLRACAVLLVVAIHAKVPYSRGGSYGVDVFFVLSGYLITQLLVASWINRGEIDLKRFYLRRALRLYPALLLFLAGWMLLSPIFYPQYAPDAWWDALVSAVYLSDYTRAFWGVPAIIGHTWSLSVEEHFYILWPLALLFLLRRCSIQRSARVMFVAFIAFTLWRILWVVAGQTWGEIYFRFDTRMSGLALGCAYALWSHGRQSAPQPLLPWLGATLILASMHLAPVTSQLSLTAGFTAVEIGTLLIIHGLAAQGAARSILSAPPMAYMGRISYGVYLWHYPIVFYLYTNGYGFAVALIVGGGLSCIAAAASYVTVERIPRRISQRLKRGVSLGHNEAIVEGGRSH